MTMTTYKPDFKRAYVMANSILVTASELVEFPLKVKFLINKNQDINCCSFKKAQQKYQLSVDNFGSKSAILMEMDKKMIIFYNESEPKPRIRFSILHEYGHFVLGHDLETKSKEQYIIFEVETNFFAAQLQMPEQLIRYLQARGIRVNVELLMEVFGVSREAAEKRLKTLSQNFQLTKEEKLFDDIILDKYQNWLVSKLSISSELFLDDYEKQMERDTWIY
ncbi:MAG: ImmA/IrrE family metallo-endopeptidase [Clostridia bacterium]|nr:ImmA/IrrE family metallo-endopeptidase [Clostridia bacterium]